MQKVCMLICLCLVMSCAFVSAQTSVNPDISAIGVMQMYHHNESLRMDEYNKVNFDDPEVEVNINGYLNPYSRADIVFGWKGEDKADVEEAYATILRGLPLNANFRFGKYLLEFGRLNTTHPHAYSFIQRPLVQEQFFGEEGLSDMAMRASFSVPTGEAFTEIMGGITKGDALQGHHHDEAEAVETTDAIKRNLGFYGRVTTSIATSEFSELALGGSFLSSVYGYSEDTINTPKQLRSTFFGGDLKYKYKPSKYKSLQIESEIIIRNSDLDEDGKSLRSIGTYTYVDYRFNQKYNIGGIYEWLKIKDENHDLLVETVEEQVTKRIGLFVGFSPLEESSLVRLASYWTSPENEKKYFETILQFVFSLGPHNPHSF